MKSILCIFLFISISVFAQDSIEVRFLKKTNLDVELLISADDFGGIYFIKDNVFYKEIDSKKTRYNNLILGDLHSVNVFNSLKINLFYKDFNTVIVLDNRLAEIFKIDFNTVSLYKNVSHISTGYDNTIWIFNQDLQKLEVFDYKTRTTRAQTAPIKSPVLDLKSNYNNCYLLTKNFLYVYNYFGSLVKKVKNNGFTSLVEANENVFLIKDNTLFFMSKNKDTIMPIKTPDLLINQFFVINQTLYIYGNGVLQEFQLKID